MVGLLPSACSQTVASRLLEQYNFIDDKTLGIFMVWLLSGLENLNSELE